MFKNKEIRRSLRTPEARTKAPGLGLAVRGSRLRMEGIYPQRGRAEPGTEVMVLAAEPVVFETRLSPSVFPVDYLSWFLPVF